MVYGLQIENDSGELTLSDSGITFSYVGQASLAEVVQPGGSGDSFTSGYSRYIVNWTGPAILVALPLKLNYNTSLVRVAQSGSTWTVFVHNGPPGTDAKGFHSEEATEVYIFGAPTTVSGWGMALYDDNGNVCADLTRIPLSFVSRIYNDGTGTNSTAFPAGVTTPCIIGSSYTQRSIFSSNGSGRFIYRRYAPSWILQASGSSPSGTGINPAVYLISYDVQDGGGTSFTNTYPVTAALIDASIFV